jgi:hypothetical protein
MTEENAKKKTAKTVLEIGDVNLEDGTIFAGISPDTGKKMYVTPNDAPISMDFNAAAEYAKNLEVGGKKDFRVPSKAELKVLFDNREKGALKGTFNLTGPAAYYLSSTLDNVINAWLQRFSDGKQGYDYPDTALSVRCIR